MSSKPIQLIDETDRIRKFREARVEAIVAGRTPVPLGPGGRVALHVAALGRPARLDLQPFGKEMWRLKPLSSSGLDARPNFDGLLTYSLDSDGASTYLQLFRDGSIETVRTMRPREGAPPLIPSVNFEKEIIEVLPRCISIQEQLGLKPPFVALLSLVGVSGYGFAIDMRRGMHEEGGTIPEDLLLAPELVVESFTVDAPSVLKPLFDQIWNAAGWRGSLNYVDGVWAPPM